MWTPDEANAGEAPARANMAGLGMTTPQPDPAETGPVDYRQTATARDDTQPELLGMSPKQFTETMLPAFRDPELMMKLGEIAAKYKQPQFLDYLKRGYDAQKENAGDAMLALARGDKQAALMYFNGSGQHKADSIDDNGDGSFNVNIRGADGNPYVRKVNPVKDLPTFLTLPKFIEHQSREAKLDLQAKGLDARSADLDRRLASVETIAAAKRAMDDKVADIRDRHNKETEALGRQVADNNYAARMAALDAKLQTIGMAGQVAGARTELLKAQTELANARTGAVGAEKPVNWAAAQNDILRRAKLHAYSQVDIPGKLGEKKMDAGRAETLANFATKWARSNPGEFGGDPGRALDAGVEKLRTIEQQVGEQTKKEVELAKAAEPWINKGDFWQNKATVKIGDKMVPVKATGPSDFEKKTADLLTSAALAREGLASAGLPEKTQGSRLVSGAITSTATPAIGDLFEGAGGQIYIVREGKAVTAPDGTRINGQGGAKMVVKAGKLVAVQ